MIIPPEVKRQFNEEKPIIDELAKRVKEVLIPYCEKHGYAIVYRVKTLDSISEKIESGRYQKWSDLDDRFGAVLVIPSTNAESDTVKFLQEQFETCDLRRKGQTLKSPDAFRFDLTRFVGTLKLHQSGETPESLENLRFEVQIRTAFEHAWCVTTHSLNYKSPEVSWEKARLTAQLKASVEQLDTLLMAFSENAATIQPSKWPDIELRIMTLATFRKLGSDKIIPSEVCPKDWSRFAENVISLLRASKSAPNRRNDRSYVEKALKALDSEFRNYDSKTFPRSVSLFQLVHGHLLKAEIIKQPLKKNSPLVNESLSTLFQDVKIREGFQFD